MFSYIKKKSNNALWKAGTADPKIPLGIIHVTDKSHVYRQALHIDNLRCSSSTAARNQVKSRWQANVGLKLNIHGKASAKLKKFIYMLRSIARQTE